MTTEADGQGVPVPETGTGQRRRDAAATRRRLLGAAARRFTLDGYERTTLREIAAEAGVNLALVKRYFGSKEGLFEACLALTPDMLPDLVDEPTDPAEVVRILARHFSSGAWPDYGEHPLLLFLRNTGDPRTDVLRRTAVQAFTERLLRATADEPSAPDALLRAQLIVALSAGIAVLRATVGIQPLLDATPGELLGPLTDVIAALLPESRETPLAWRTRTDEACLVGNDDKLRTVASVQFRHSPMYVGTHGVRAEVEPGGDLVVAVALGGQGHDLPLTGREIGEDLRGRRVPAGLGSIEKAGDERTGGLRRQQGVPTGDGADASQEFVGAGALAEEAAGAGPQRAGDVFVGFEGRQYEDASANQVRVIADGLGGGQSVGAGHADVHHDDVGMVRAGEFGGFPAVGCFADHLHIGGRADQDAEGLAQQGLVIGQQDSDGHWRRSSSRWCRCNGSSAVTSNPPKARGPACSRPPTDCARSRIPIRP